LAHSNVRYSNPMTLCQTKGPPAVGAKEERVHVRSVPDAADGETLV
jgi:hypothetical protein